ncbi:MAG: hypothetical protein BWK76_20400 [Desulfobulbaceae bacterium A2]|nr:MAG: hypothetical protein BWK76_20400 [Desulfobulbaceae bacterium A2]
MYLHLPFCRRRCPYCAFAAVAGAEQLIPAYLTALRRELARRAPHWQGRTLQSIYCGGGTPSLIPAEELTALVAECRRTWGAEAEALETTVEVNPATIDEAALSILRRGGVNRLSIGVQSLRDDELRTLGRLHDAATAVATVRQARSAGFNNLGIDLIFGLPGQTAAQWRETLQRAIELTPEHISLYELTLEENTPFAARQTQGTLALPPEEEVLAMMQLSETLLPAAGLLRYEIANYARPGRESRHNRNYWQNGDYLGLGAAAVSCLNGRRWSNERDPARYCEILQAGNDPLVDEETLPPEARFRETVMLGLRTIAGVDLAELQRRFGLDARSYYGDTLNALLRQGLLELAGPHLRLTRTGLPLANRVMAELI